MKEVLMAIAFIDFTHLSHISRYNYSSNYYADLSNCCVDFFQREYDRVIYWTTNFSNGPFFPKTVLSSFFVNDRFAFAYIDDFNND